MGSPNPGSNKTPEHKSEEKNKTVKDNLHSEPSVAQLQKEKNALQKTVRRMRLRKTKDLRDWMQFKAAESIGVKRSQTYAEREAQRERRSAPIS